MKKRTIPNDIYGMRIIYKNPANPDDTETAYKIRNILAHNYETRDAISDDYIENPKSNNYRSLHLYIYYQMLVEIQIRSNLMDIGAKSDDYY